MSAASDTNPGSKPPAGTRSIQRTMSLLDAFRYGEEWLPLREIAARVSLPKPTAHRILNALASTGLIENGDDGRYRLGVAASELGYRATLARLPSAPKPTPFSASMVSRSSSFAVREWNGSIGAVSFDPTFEREYFAIRGGAAILDVSPLFLYEFRGPQAEHAVQRILTRDVAACRTDQVMYSAWCNDDGALLQDGNLIRLAPDCFRLSAAEATLRWFEDCALGLDVEVRDIGDRVAKLAVQGPLSRSVLGRVLEGEAQVDALSRLGYFRGCRARFGNHSVYVTRTGFTGDLGYELWFDLPTEARGGKPGQIDYAPAAALWEELLNTDLGPSVVPMGLEALDAARIEAGLILIDVDYFSASHCLVERRRSTPDEAGLGWAVKLVPRNQFVGRRRIEEERARGVRWRFVGLEIEWEELERAYEPFGLRPQMVGRPPSREPMQVRGVEGEFSGAQIGQVTSSYFSPRLKKELGLATVRSDHAKVGSLVEVVMRIEKRPTPLRAKVVQLPFYDPPHKKGPAREFRVDR